MRRPLPALMILLALAACGPIPVHQAESMCFETARLAAGPRGSISMGATSGGHVAGGIELQISSDYLQGKDPSAVYDACVYQKSGQPPSLPLYSRPDWKG